MFKNVSLLEVREKTKRSNAVINNRIHWFSSKLSIYFSYFFINIGLSADRITNLFLLTGVVGAIYVNYPVISYLLWRLHIILDMSDGDVARFNQSFSIRGKYWDRINHSLINPGYCFFVGLNFYNKYDYDLFLYLGVMMMFLQSFVINSKYFIESDYSAINLRFSNNLIISRLKNIIIDMIGMEGLLFTLVLFAEYHTQQTSLFVMSSYIVLFLCSGLFQVYKRSF